MDDLITHEFPLEQINEAHQTKTWDAGKVLRLQSSTNKVREYGSSRYAEVFGLATAFAAADAGCKAGNVRLRTLIKINLRMQTNCLYR